MILPKTIATGSGQGRANQAKKEPKKLCNYVNVLVTVAYRWSLLVTVGTGGRCWSLLVTVDHCSTLMEAPLAALLAVKQKPLEYRHTS